MAINRVSTSLSVEVEKRSPCSSSSSRSRSVLVRFPLCATAIGPMFTLGDHRSRVADAARSLGRVPGVTDCDVTRQQLQVVLGKGLTDETNPRADREVVAIRGGNAGALLSAVLECIESEERQAGNVFTRSKYAKHPAFFVRFVIEWIVGEIVAPVIHGHSMQSRLIPHRGFLERKLHAFSKHYLLASGLADDSAGNSLLRAELDEFRFAVRLNGDDDS